MRTMPDFLITRIHNSDTVVRSRASSNTQGPGNLGAEDKETIQTNQGDRSG